ncbi:MAG TPA: peptidoglycan DD-metalloendopeptidase family protein [Chitinophagaceae bacterium]|jgi:hypothetical protein|nr:peptidoglycan DD-metalloendopeptidase family protein [Chitinophagaceae bacterium]
MNPIRSIRTFLVLIVSTTSLATLAQPVEITKYSRNYFRNPLDIPMQLSANFGELRPNHWHMGLDIRTEAKENLPVHAAADGYIAHAGIRSQSFGRFIIINHPNGLSTLYAHLNDFNPDLEQYVTEQQYKQESWAVELDFTKDQFPVDKGSFIAYSGNTGGSQGPHLHFEIIDTKTDRRINPLLFSFPMEDKLPPLILKLAMYDRSKPMYAQSPVLYSLKNTDSGYIIPKNAIINTGLNRVSFAIQSHDRMSGGGSDNGIYSAKLYLDDEPQLGFALDSIDYDETVYINSHIDYRYDYYGGAYLQQLSQLPGDHCPIYKQIKNDGVIEFSDTAVHLVSIDVKDVSGNTAQLNFSIRYYDTLAKAPPAPTTNPKFIPGTVSRIEKEDFKIEIPERSIYDTITTIYYRNNASSYNAVTAMHQVNDASYPVHQDLTVSIKPNKSIPEEWKDKLIMQRTSKGSTIRKVQLKNGWFTAKYSDFGNFQVVADLTAPQIDELGKGDTVNLSPVNMIVFSPADNYGIVKNFRVLVTDSTGNTQWIRFTNDKSRNWIYRFDDRIPYGVYKMTATATDLVGNSTTKEWWFKRYPYTPPPKKKAVKKGSTKKGKSSGTMKKTTTTKKAPAKKPVVKKKK